jgi:hypothetical protein
MEKPISTKKKKKSKLKVEKPKWHIITHKNQRIVGVISAQ